MRKSSFFLGLLASGALLGQSPTPFTDVTDSAGIQHQFRVLEGMFGGGACVLDYNLDGFEDVYLTGGTADDQLLRNNGDGTMTNVFEGSGLELTRRFVTQGVSGADVNRDGYVDLFITTITARDSARTIPRAKNLLFLNQGDGTFADATDEFGLGPLYSFSTGGSFGDFNADGWPDLYVGNYFIGYEGKLSVISDATIVGANQTAYDYLLRNDQGTRFTNVYEDYGLRHRGFGFGGLFTDFDNDGDQDLIVNNDFGYKATPSYVLENRSPRKKFNYVEEDYALDLKINAMGSAAGDYNQDGYLDYYVTNIRFNRFMVSQGPGKPFVNLTKEMNMHYVSISWGANWGDYDHDGDLDLFVSNGDLNPNCVPMANFYFENDGNTFREIGKLNGVGDYGIGRGSVAFDLENDGDLDLLVVAQEPVLPNYPVASVTRLFRNDGARGKWLKVALRGLKAEKNGIGSRVTVFSQGRQMIREIDGGGSSHLSQNSTIAHFGLGDVTTVDSVLVTWAGGKQQLLTNQPVNQLLVIEESARNASGTFPWWLFLSLVGLAVLGTYWWPRSKGGKE
ncbi:CRTAC1 family protein [Neolewinella lacunae]|uniref:CRTAC1 family protein n=1 Tax=Neolewinella lacunae TaxID=1517758 RepID=A0A923PRD1_9BACT|nr:CRTAC1 family protein [Neolewinella lacunae]MBC6996063.1 CRTAC1 family protein [Neolewinella lacunae]MDN3636817.1 CRTAC1 family protein [Neolewinella lacunae]